MAINYENEWEKLRKRHGGKGLIGDHGNTILRLSTVMDEQTKATIAEREKLMEEYIKGRITTNIADGIKSLHLVDVFFEEKLFGRVTISKEDFQKWVDEKHKKEIHQRGPVIFTNVTE